MNFMTEKCMTQLDQQGMLRVVGMAMGWVAGREYKRAHEGAEAVAAWDEVARDYIRKVMEDPAGNEILTLSGGKATDEFIQAMGEFFENTPVCPGWDESKCELDWPEFACFCSAAAKTLTNDQIVELGKTQPKGTPISYQCDPAVKADPSYTTAGDSMVPATVTEKKRSWLPWALGGIALVAVAGVVVSHSRKDSAEQNPSRMRTKFHRDGTVTYWDVYSQKWRRTPANAISPEVLSSLPKQERDRILKNTRKNPSQPHPVRGSAFQLSGDRPWQSARNDDWDPIVLGDVPRRMTYVGSRLIDGSLHNVFSRSGYYYAQLAQMVSRS